MRQDSLDRDAPIEPLEATLLGEEDLGHAATGDTPDQDVLAEPNACVGWHLPPIINVPTSQGIRGCA
jgi:hypothetical protein